MSWDGILGPNGGIDIKTLDPFEEVDLPAIIIIDSYSRINEAT